MKKRKYPAWMIKELFRLLIYVIVAIFFIALFIWGITKAIGE